MIAPKKTISYLKLPFLFEKEALLKDLKTISEEMWLPQIYKMNYDGEWTSLALFARDGENNTFAFGNADGELKETIALKKCDYFRQVISTFQCPLISVRLLKLNAGSVIKAHQDFKLGYEDNNFRIHIPITTNERVEFILDGERLKMLPGECWYTNVNFVHSVANRGTQDRVHLVLDGERNDWSDKLFFSLAPRERFNLDESQSSKETRERIIEELKNINGLNSKELIEQLENDLKLSP